MPNYESAGLFEIAIFIDPEGIGEVKTTGEKPESFIQKNGKIFTVIYFNQLRDRFKK